MTSLARTVSVIFWSTLLMSLAMLATSQSWQSILAVITSGCLAAVGVPTARSLARALFGRSSWWGRRVFVIGSDSSAVSLYTRLHRQPQRELRPVGMVDDIDALDPDLDPALYLGPPEALRELGQTLRVSAAVVASSAGSIDAQRLFCREENGIRDWFLMSTLDGFPSLWGNSLDVAGSPAIWARNRLLLPWSRGLKRGADLTITFCAVATALPFIAAIVALIRLSSPGPALYCHERIGRHGRRFQAWKFRTMVLNADQVLEEHLAADPLLRAEWEANHKLKRDPRVTVIGMFLRKSSLDELPQLWNVVRGEMSLVGPRPIVAAEIDKYADQYEFYVEVLPGLTGLWQVSGRNNTTYQERIALDAFYVKNWSLWMDLYILISTIRVLALREGAY